MTSCARTNTIAALLAGAADPAAAEQLEVHLDECPDCRRLVADLGRGLSAISASKSSPSTDRLPRVGEKLGRYEIRRVIGVGGMGVVYEGHDTTLDRRVAVKLLRPDLLEGSSLLAEAQAMARLQHPNIATVHDVGVANDQVYICMEYVAGSTLRAWASARRRDWRAIATVFAAAGAGLAYVHRAGLVHLDFKPDNVLVDAEGRARVTDFGVARIVGARPAARIIVGTPAYMAPEQKSGNAADARADQFAFCVSLRESLGDGHVPLWLRRVIDRGTAAHPDDRFATMDELLAMLAAGLAPRRQRTVAIAVTGAAALAALAISLAPNPARLVTQIIERPVAHPVTTYRDVIVERPGAAPVGSLEQRVGVAGERRAEASPLLASRGFVAPRRPPALDLEPSAFVAELIAAATEASDDTEMPTVGAGGCDDGSERTCAWWPPSCPAGTMLAIQQGCWTCADTQTCGPLGFPRTCNDGSPLVCKQAPPTCTGHRIASVRNGCWSCEDPFTCHSWSQPTQPPPRPPPPAGSGSSGGSNSGSNGGSNAGAPRCGNGFCETGESHAGCPSDCCETSGSGACLAKCGNGFCEPGEDHASCARDCCELSGSGACAPVCGNGFCEQGETAASCASDC